MIVCSLHAKERSHRLECEAESQQLKAITLPEAESKVAQSDPAPFDLSARRSLGKITVLISPLLDSHNVRDC